MDNFESCTLPYPLTEANKDPRKQIYNRYYSTLHQINPELANLYEDMVQTVGYEMQKNGYLEYLEDTVVLQNAFLVLKFGDAFPFHRMLKISHDMYESLRLKDLKNRRVETKNLEEALLSIRQEDPK